MAWKPRLECVGAIYHVMNCGNRRQAISRTDGDRRYFLAALGELSERDRVAEPCVRADGEPLPFAAGDAGAQSDGGDAVAARHLHQAVQG